MMQAGVRVSVTCTSSAVTSIRRDEPFPPGATSQGDILDKSDFRPTPSERLKTFTALGGVTLRARAPKWALNPIRARVEAPQGRVVLTKTGGDPLGQWSSVGIRPTFEWCLVLPNDVTLGLEPSEVVGTLVAFLPNGGDIEANVRKVAQSCTPADIDRYRGILKSHRDRKISGEPKPPGPAGTSVGSQRLPGQPPQVPPGRPQTGPPPGVKPPRLP